MVENVVDWDLLEMEDFRLKRGSKANKKNRNDVVDDPYKGIEMLTPVRGELVNAKYDGLKSDQHCFSVPGYKDYVRVDNRPSENKYLKNISVGNKIDVLISNVKDGIDYMIGGSISEIYESRAHQSLKDLDDNAVVIANIKSSSPAGYDVEIIHGGITLPGFMPNTLAGINRLHDPESITNQSLPVMIESFAREEGTYIVSRRKYLKTLIPDAIKELEYNHVYTGHVTGTAQFGVFVEFNECLTGMIHKANISEEWRDRLSEIKPGTEIEFYVKEVIMKEEKIILTQILRETLWDTIRSGQVIEGVIKDNKRFGTLVLLDDETIGLIHISEVEKFNKKLNPDDDVLVKVLAVDRTNRKIFLTISEE